VLRPSFVAMSSWRSIILSSPDLFSGMLHFRARAGKSAIKNRSKGSGMRFRMMTGAGAMLMAAACAGSAAPAPDAPQPQAQQVAASAPAASPAARVRQAGFLNLEITPDATAIIPPAPKQGEPRNDVDWATFRATRALEGSERWVLAAADDSYRPAYLLSAYSCAVGVQLTPENSPTLAVIIARTTADAGAAAAGAKDVYKRTRPYLHNDGNICIAKSDGLAASYDYPSGHASLGWTSGLVIAALAPDRSTQVLARARAYGESRVVCGVHNASAVEAARTNAASVFAALQGSPEFLAAMEKAKAEIAAARASGATPDAAACAKQAELIRPLPHLSGAN
jgi:acid phosphatase (class A)